MHFDDPVDESTEERPDDLNDEETPAGASEEGDSDSDQDSDDDVEGHSFRGH
jgi:hypothetical protein